MKESNQGLVSKSPFQDRIKKMVGEFREQNQQFMQGNYKPPSEATKPTPKKSTPAPKSNNEHRSRAYANQLNKYQGGE